MDVDECCWPLQLALCMLREWASVAQEVLIDIDEEMAEEVAAVEQIDATLTAAATEGAIAVGPDLDETEALLGHPDHDKSPEPGVSCYTSLGFRVFISHSHSLRALGSRLYVSTQPLIHGRMGRTVHLVNVLLAPKSQQAC